MTPVQARALVAAREFVAALEALMEAPARSGPDLTIAEAMIEFGRSEDTVRRWARDLGLGRKLRNGEWRLNRAAVAAHLANRAR